MANIVLDFLHNYQTGERRESEPANAYQYDEGHVLEAVLPEVITSAEIHYWIRGMEDADAYTPTSITPNSDGSCTVLGNIPNSYFETNGELRIYIVVTDGTASITTYEGKLHICQRSMPDDYVDDDPENEATRILTEALAAATTATQQAQAASNSAGQAQQSAETLSESVEQITTNKNDISSLKDDLTAAQVELAKKANTDGYYEEMTVGNAEQLVSTVTNADDTPYNFRTTAGSADVGDRAYVDAIVGGTVALNQLSAPIDNAVTQKGVTITPDNDGSVTVVGTTTESGALLAFKSFETIKNHKYFITAKGLTSGISVYTDIGGSISTSETIRNETEDKSSASVTLRSDSNITYNAKIWVSTFDLTQMFGSTIADYVYGLETATAGAGVAWLKANAPKIFNSGYIPYNPGELVSVTGVSEKRNTGFNQWDGEYESGTYDQSTGTKIANTTLNRNKNPLDVLPLSDYYWNRIVGSGRLFFYDSGMNLISTIYMEGGAFATPTDCRYLNFAVSSLLDISESCINLSDPARNGEYEPYEEHVYPLDSSQTLRGIPKLKDGKMYFDGDRYLPDGTVQRRYGVVDLGTLNWTRTADTAGGYYFISENMPTLKKQADNYSVWPNLIIGCGYSNVASATIALGTAADKTYGGHDSGAIRIKDTSYSDVASFKSAMSGVYLVYELATPTTEQATPYQQRQIIDADGTEEFVSTSVVPVGHETRYPLDIRGRLDKLLSMPTSNGTYTLQATVTDGKVAYSWVSA